MLEIKKIKNVKLGFSLMEVLISIVIISVIISAFVPVITKKLTSRSVYLNEAIVDDDRYIIPKSQADCPSYSVYTDGRVEIGRAHV